MKYKDFEKIRKYSEGSGVIPFVDDNITMELDVFGTYKEVAKDSSKDLNPLVEMISPNFSDYYVETDLPEILYGKQSNIKFDKRIGYYNSLFVGYVEEGDYRKNASSGGMGTWIFKELLERDLIDAVIHVKENNDSKNNNILFKYDISRTLEEIQKGAKTRYYPVEMSEVLKIVRNTPGRYAIIGIPSFITSIKLLSEVDEIIKDRIKYTVGLICGHQKSSKFSEFMAWQLGITPGNLTSIDFRKKLSDRPANEYAIEVTGLINGEKETIIKPAKELKGQNWGQGFFKEYASDYWDDVFNETADIVIGDAWIPKYSKDSKGNNIVIVRDNKLLTIINESISSGKLKLENVDADLIFQSQSSHYNHTHNELSYRLFKRKNNNEWVPKKKVPSSSKISKTRKAIQDLREEISIQSHLLYQEALKEQDLAIFTNGMDMLTQEYDSLYKKIKKYDRINRIRKLSKKQILKKVKNKFLK